MATLSPTRMMSTPASSAMRAPGASYAVTITSGVSLPLLARTAGAVVALVGIFCLLPVQRPSGCRRLSGSYPVSKVRHDVGAGLRKLRSGRRRPGRRAPGLRGPGVVGYPRLVPDGRGNRVVVLLVPLPVPAPGGVSQAARA